MPTLRAIIYLREIDDECLARCESHCQRRGYRVVGVVVDPAGDRWHEVLDAGFGGQCEVVVLCRLSDLSEHRLPRMEVAEPDPAGPDVTARRRRPGWRQ